MNTQGEQGTLSRALGSDFKGKISPFLYTAGITSAWFIDPLAGLAFFVGTALMWAVPDRRIEREVEREVERDEKAE